MGLLVVPFSEMFGFLSIYNYGIYYLLNVFIDVSSNLYMAHKQMIRMYLFIHLQNQLFDYLMM